MMSYLWISTTANWVFVLTLRHTNLSQSPNDWNTCTTITVSLSPSYYMSFGGFITSACILQLYYSWSYCFFVLFFSEFFVFSLLFFFLCPYLFSQTKKASLILQNTRGVSSVPNLEGGGVCNTQERLYWVIELSTTNNKALFNIY